MNALVTFRAAAQAAIRRQSTSQEFGMYSSDLLELERSNDTISIPGVCPQQPANRHCGFRIVSGLIDFEFD